MNKFFGRSTRNICSEMKIQLMALFAILLVFSSLFAVSAAEEKYQERGRYIYDETGRLSTESMLALSSYLWHMDVKTGYELTIIFPKEKLSDDEIIARFNEYGIGKKGLDNGAAIFVFPDNSAFVAIGSGNDKVSVPYSKTYGEKTLVNLSDDATLSLMRFANTLNQKVDTSETIEILDAEKAAEMGKLTFLWIFVFSLGLLLYQQKDGFQMSDLILPVIFLAVLSIFVGIGMVVDSAESNTHNEYGVITSTEHSTYHWTEMRCTGSGKSRTCYPVFHTDYRNDVSFLTYDFKNYTYRYVTTDNKGAYQHEIGELNGLSVFANGELIHPFGIQDNSGGKTVGDGVWIYAGKN